MSVLVITTGGTIGAVPTKDLRRQPKVRTMPPKGQDFVRLALQKIPGVKTRCILLEPRDSSLIDDAYRQEILEAITKSPETMVLVTHGTNALLATADFLHRRYTTDGALKNKTVMLTGAMVPLSCGSESDGFPNLRFALKQLDAGQLGRGVYIVLCDYAEPETKTGWQPRLYRFEPGQYEKIYDPDDDRRSRIQRRANPR